jgi:hypothetical protein
MSPSNVAAGALRYRLGISRQHPAPAEHFVFGSRLSESCIKTAETGNMRH